MLCAEAQRDRVQVVGHGRVCTRRQPPPSQVGSPTSRPAEAAWQSREEATKPARPDSPRRGLRQQQSTAQAAGSERRLGARDGEPGADTRSHAGTRLWPDTAAASRKGVCTSTSFQERAWTGPLPTRRDGGKIMSLFRKSQYLIMPN